VPDLPPPSGPPVPGPPPGDDAPWWARPEGGQAPSWWQQPGPGPGPGPGPQQAPGAAWQQPPPGGMPFAARPDPAFARTYAPRPVGRAKGAVAALVWGILAVVCCGFIGGAIAIYQGSQARYRIRASNGRLGGNGMALAGMLLGGLGILQSVVVLWATLTGHRYGFPISTTTTTFP
jgi:hypothetical protein